MLKEIIIALQSYFKAHQFIRKHKLWKWIIIPGLVYMALFIVSMYFFSKSATGLIGYITEASGIKDWIQRMQNSWLGFFFTLAGVILWIILMFFYFSLFKYIWLIAGSPVFAYLSEKTESILEGKDFPFSWSQLFRDAIRGIKLALRNSLWQTVYTISILLLSFIPLIGWATPILALFVECYYYGFSMLDYSCERHKLTPAQSIEFVAKHKGLAIGNGLVFYLMHGIVVIGWILAPAYAVVAATISLYHQKDEF
ncbi:MAG: EI24 domain-containing protein [Chitinophagaceae bacterium]|nr:EI24 domain-containing protein [Chitinophagaceae bacterium]